MPDDMRIADAIEQLNFWDKRQRYVYAKRDLSKVFSEPIGSVLNATLNRLVSARILTRAARGVYVYSVSAHVDAYTIEVVADTLRRGAYNFVSMESALSDYGLISQIPIDRITVMTTGRRGEYHTPYGVIEFTHTKRNPMDILEHTVLRPPHRLRIATEEFAMANLRRVGRNLNMVEGQEKWRQS
jgi:predicted transcriptional regulator of viral defense system